jgi:hypothetical protein
VVRSAAMAVDSSLWRSLFDGPRGRAGDARAAVLC